MARHRSLALPAVAVLLSVLAACASASLSDGERMLEENRFTEAARALRDIADRESADDAERARAARGLAVAYLAREEGVEAVKACATAIILDPGHPGNTGLVKTIERELGLSGVPEGWDDTLGLIVEAADPYPILRDYVVDIEIATARFHGDSEARWEATAKYGCVRDYMIAGPFPNTGGSGIYERYPPEDEIDLGAEYTDHLGRRFGWESWSQGGRCYIDLDLFLGDEPNAVAYALTHVRADERIEGTAHLFGGGAFRLWVNGSPVLRERTTRMGGRSLYEAPVVLHEGWNRVLLKAASETEPMDFAFRFRDAEDRPLYLDCDPDPGVYDKTGAPGSPVVPGMPTYTFESLPESNWLKQWRGSLDDAPLCDWYFYIFFIMGHGFEIESEAAIESCAERFPESAVLDGVRAELLVAQDRSGEAASIRRELAEESPEYTPASTFVVGEALEQGDIDEAWNEASTALSRNPNNVTLRAMHGALLAGRGSVNEGITEMEAAFEEEPGNVAARTLYLMILRALRGESEYEAALERALEARPDDPSLARQAASAAFEREDYDAAVEHLRDAERAGDRADVVSLSVGMVLEEAGKLEEALETYEEGLAVAPRSVTLHEVVARLFQRMGDDERALDHYKEVVARRPMAFSSKELIRRLEDRPPLDDYFADEELDPLLDADVSWVDDESVAVRLLESQNLIVYSDGASTLRRHIVTRVLSEAGVETYGSASTPYYFDSSEGRIEVARTIKSDGREVDAEKGFGEVTFADVEPGDVVELQYSSRYGPTIGLPGHFWHRHFFETEIPCVVSRTALLVPSGTEYRWDVHGADLEPSSEEHGEWRLDTWEMENVPGAVVESRMPPWTEVGVWIDVSTISDWSKIIDWYHSISRGRLHGGRRALELAYELGALADGDHERVKVVVDHVRKNIKYEGSGFIESGLVPRSLEEVIRTKLGDCKDQSILLVFLLRELGVKADIALVNDRSVSSTERLPSPDFTHAIVRAEVPDGSVYWIDPTEKELGFPNVPVGLEGAHALLIDVDDPGFLTVEPDAPGMNGSDSVLEATISEDGDLAVEGECSYRGEDAAGFRYVALHYSEMLEEMKRDIIAAEHPAAVVTEAEFEGAEDTDRDMKLTFSFKRTGAVSRAGDLMIVGVPWTVGTVPYDLVSLEERVHPLILDSWRGSYAETIELEVPDGYALGSELPAVETECGAGRFSLHGERTEDGTIVLTKRLDIDVFRVEPEDYPEFRAMLETGWRAEEQQLVFGRE